MVLAFPAITIHVLKNTFDTLLLQATSGSLISLKFEMRKLLHHHNNILLDNPEKTQD
jgi:hypothetical protein